MQIRQAVDADAAAVAVFAEQTFRDAFAADNSAADMAAYCRDNFGEAIQRREILDSGGRVLLADSDGALAGFAHVLFGNGFRALAAEDSAELRRIYVSTRHQGSGVAQALLGRVVTETVAAGLSQLWLGVWEHNPRAIRFYRKTGFEVIGEHEFTLGSQQQRDIVMSRRVG